MLHALLFTSIFAFIVTLTYLIHLEKLIMALKDSVAKLTEVVAANTAATVAIPSASDVATAVTAIDAANAQLATNNQTLAGDVATA